MMRRDRVCWVLPLLLASTGAAMADTDVRIYGFADVSIDEVDNGIQTKTALATNNSYLGFAAQSDVTDDIKVLFQAEGALDLTATPAVKDTFASRNSFIGFASKDWGTIKGGKSDTPYKTATAAFDPFSGGIADYNSIMGNTGGDGRAEFDQRANHAIWYESPNLGGLVFSLMWSPGQNQAGDSGNFPLGDNTCQGSTFGGNGSGGAGVQNTFGGSAGTGRTFTGGFTVGTGFSECTDGAFGDLYSTSAVYKKGGFTGLAAAELHHAVNRVSDAVPGGNGNLANQFFLKAGDGSFALTTATEWAAKVGAGYDLGNGLKLAVIGEYMRRTQVQSGFNERTRYGVFGSAVWRFLPKDEVMASYSHAFSTPGNPGVNQVNQTCPGGNGNQDDQADLFGIGMRHYFTPAVTVYWEAALVHNHDCAHYGLGASGHGIVYLQRNQFNETFPGKDLAGISAGATFRF
jgi:predicted porin